MLVLPPFLPASICFKWLKFNLKKDKLTVKSPNIADFIHIVQCEYKWSYDLTICFKS